METIPSALPTLNSCPTLQHRRLVLPAGACYSYRLCRKMRGMVQSASRGDARHEHSSKDETVDKSMVVLRRRIKELRSSTDNQTKDHAACVYQAVGLLQLALMNTRPALGIAIAAMVALSLPNLVIFILLHLMKWGGN